MSSHAASGVLGPLSTADLRRAVAAIEPGMVEGLRAVEGTHAHHALIDTDETDMAWASNVAERLSAEHPGKFYAFAAAPDFYWLTIFEAGEMEFDDEGAIDNIARDLGCPIRSK